MKLGMKSKMSLNGVGVTVTWKHPVLIRLLAWLLATLVTAMIGPFTTYETFSFAERLAYWGGLIGAGLLLAYLIRMVVLPARPRDSLGTDMVAAIVQSVVLGPLIWAFNHFVLGFDLGTVLWVFEHIAVVFVICLAINFVRAYLRPAPPKADEQPVSEPPTAVVEPPAFLRRLDADLGQELLHVSASDHYLHVVTRRGETRFLMRFRDAIEELAELPGYRIHRSHWVSKDALSEIRQEGRRHIAVLVNGVELPISQANLDALRRDRLIR